jgi:predicted kinase
MDLLYRSAAALLETGQSVAGEANFYAEWDTPNLLALANTTGYHFVQVVCTASKSTLPEWYRHRSLTSERHPGHTESEQLEETIAQLFTGSWEPRNRARLRSPGPTAPQLRASNPRPPARR